MGFFVLNSQVTICSTVDGIGTLEFSGVHEVHIKKSMHSITETATITLPSKANFIDKKGSAPKPMTTGQMFNDRDPVEIRLGYNGVVNEEFSGFIKHRNLDMPLVIECEGYVQRLRLDVNVTANFNKKSTTAKDLLNLACQGTGISVQCPFDFRLKGINAANWNGVQICDAIKEASDHTLSIFFIAPDTLWCGLAYTAYNTAGPAALPPAGKGATGNGSVFNLPRVNYRVGFNTPKSNSLKQKDDSNPVQVTMNGKLANGVKIEAAKGDSNAARKTKSTLNKITDADTLAMLAGEKALQMNYTGFEGKVTGFLQPFAQPGYEAYIVDARYPDLSNIYLIESTEVKFGVSGARRTCEIGPKVGFQ